MAQKLDETLKEMSAEITGYIASTVVGLDGMSIAQHTRSKVDPELISAQMALLFKLVDTTMVKVNGGTVEDNLTTTENAYVMMHYLPGKKYFLGIVTDHKTANLGNMRLIGKIYAERLAKVIPH